MLKNFLKTFKQNIIKSFSGKNLLWHFLAIALTYLIVISGFDWFYFESTRNKLLLQITAGSGIIGFGVPVLLPIFMYVLDKHKKYISATLATAQAGIIAYLISIFYKALTGRIQPEFMTHTVTADYSHEFNFGFLQHGVFWGWPSSHTAVAFAMSVALVIFFKNQKYIKYPAIIYAFFIGIGASIGFHWFSDFLAGAIIGTLVGIVVAKNTNS